MGLGEAIAALSDEALPPDMRRGEPPRLREVPPLEGDL